MVTWARSMTTRQAMNYKYKNQIGDRRLFAQFSFLRIIAFGHKK